jgi:hypothetical protein
MSVIWLDEEIKIMECFECQLTITDGEKYFSTFMHDATGTHLHWSCVRRIINNYIAGSVRFDEDMNKRAGEQNPNDAANALADKLHFRKAGE